MAALAHSPLAFVTCATSPAVLANCLLASPCLAAGAFPLAAHFGSPSAAWAFNKEMAGAPAADWLVWVHQDVFLPNGWEREFLAGIAAAERQLPALAVVGLYGIGRKGESFQRAGHVVDRGAKLCENTPLPCEVDSIDELLVAVRVASDLRFDPALGFDFYGTDAVLAAQEVGKQAAVVDAPCEHRSTLPAHGAADSAMLRRVLESATVFERKWAHRMPLETPCFSIHQPGDVARFLATHFRGVV